MVKLRLPSYESLVDDLDDFLPMCLDLEHNISTISLELDDVSVFLPECLGRERSTSAISLKQDDCGELCKRTGLEPPCGKPELVRIVSLHNYDYEIVDNICAGNTAEISAGINGSTDSDDRNPEQKRIQKRLPGEMLTAISSPRKRQCSPEGQDQLLRFNSFECPTNGITDSVSLVPNIRTGTWLKEEDERLRDAVKRVAVNRLGSDGQWNDIAAIVGTRDAGQCSQRWNQSLAPDLAGRSKGRWKPNEDQALREAVHQFGTIGFKIWTRIAEAMNHKRTSRQCRDRWYKHLDPSINKQGWTAEEDKTLIRSHKQFGSLWWKIAQQLPGRTAERVKRRFNMVIKRCFK